MKQLEKRIVQLGFSVLQEKEDLVYFEKTFFNVSDEDHKVFVLYDRKDNKIKGIDPYVLSDEDLKPISDERYWQLFKRKRTS